jgi:hypothetical protein
VAKAKKKKYVFTKKRRAALKKAQAARRKLGKNKRGKG